MKPSIKFLILAAALTCGFAKGQTTAYTTPVGYVTVGVPANADTTITPGLIKSPVFSGVTTSVNGSELTVTGITSGAFVSPNPQTYVQVTSGSLSGMIFPVTANSASTITVDSGATSLQSMGFVAGNSIKVIPYWTLNTLFPLGNGVGTTADALNPSSFVMVSDYQGTGPNRASGKLYFYCTGDSELGLPAGWYDNADPFAGAVNDTIIDPTIQYTIRSVSSAQVVITGEVPTSQVSTEIVTSNNANDNYMAVPFPVDISLQDSGLQSVIAGTSDALNPTEFVFVYDDASEGFNKSASAAYFYCTGDAELGLSAGWYDNADPFAGVVTSKVLKAGRCFILRKAPSTAGVIDWVAPLPYTL